MSPSRPGRPCFCLEFDVLAYPEAWDLQQRLVALKKNRPATADAVMLLEHSAVFTLGRRGERCHLKVSESFLQARNIRLQRVERGGEITYHGPGQLVAYPIIDLRRAGLGVLEYVEGLEAVMMATAREWGIAAVRNPLNRGIWVGNRKLGSVGIAVRRGIAFHGFALNVNVNLDPFGWINPCGLEGISATSMCTELGRRVSLGEVRAAVRRHLQNGFGLELVEIEMQAAETHGRDIEARLTISDPVRSKPRG